MRTENGTPNFEAVSAITPKIVEKPIFVVGAGRSGSSIFHKMFSEHPDIAWLSARLCNKYPDRPSINGLLMKWIDSQLLGDFLRNRFHPGEGYLFWDHFIPGFSEPYRDLVAKDATNRIKNAIPSVFSQVLTSQRSRLLLKITGWPRIGFLQEIFKDALFIHIRRDKQAVINSLVNVEWWSGWRGPQNWRWGNLSSEQMKEWARFDYSFLALAGIELKILDKAMERAARLVDESQLLEVHYEDMCADPTGVFQSVTEFCQLRWPTDFENRLGNYNLINNNHRWRQDLTTEQQSIVEHFA